MPFDNEFITLMYGIVFAVLLFLVIANFLFWGMRIARIDNECRLLEVCHDNVSRDCSSPDCIVLDSPFHGNLQSFCLSSDCLFSGL